MNVHKLGTLSDGTKTIEIRSSDISYRALARKLEALTGVQLQDVRHNAMTDDTKGSIYFKDQQFELSAPFSDYHISCKGTCPERVWDEFLTLCADFKVHWWEKII